MVKLNKIYTRTGDKGTAGLVDGSRVSKSSLRMTAIGEIDEANAAIGVAIGALDEGPVSGQLREIQNDLFDLGADIATPGEVKGALRIVASQVERLERDIDVMNTGLAPLESFILPGGSASVAALHLARAIVRRAERAAVALNDAEPLNPQLLAYLNRLSDHLFVAARHVASMEGGDVLWKPGKHAANRSTGGT
jgi:cob(I)alamin adenosyltransferase